MGSVSVRGEESHVDVLIVGAGPSGLMMAEWMSKTGIRTRVVDKRGTKIFNGQADGLQSRTLEIFDSFDFGHRAWRESNHMLEICMWNPDARTGRICRTDRIPDTVPGISRFQQVVVHQGRIERWFLDSIKENSIQSGCNGVGVGGEIGIEHGVMPVGLELDETLVGSTDAYPVTVRLRHLTEDEATPRQIGTSTNGQAIQDGLFRSNLAVDDTVDFIRQNDQIKENAGREEVVKAKYVVGADGAHSWVRGQIGCTLEGDSTDYVWGVLDVIPITDFPDIRMRCVIHSESDGSVMTIPRENKMVRLYVQLTTTDTSGGKRVDRSKINPETIITLAQKIMKPYKIDYKYLDWWTAYQIGQRVGDTFSLHERIFLAGDAVHTHSPKAGQGMNVSMQDTYNLGWKIASVVKGTAHRSVLKTYQSERRRVAQDLIEFDHYFSRLCSGKVGDDVGDGEGVSTEVFRQAFEKANMYASGIPLDYGASMIVAKEGESVEQGDGTDVQAKTGLRVFSKQSLATNIRLGQRMPSFKVLNQADARPWHFQELLKSNGAWRVVIFAGNVSLESQKARLQELGRKLHDPKSFLKRFTPAEWRYDSVIDFLSVHSAPRREMTIFDFPEAFRPWHDSEGWDYWKIHVDDLSYHEGHGEAYKNYGVDTETGCAVILRPDQYVSWIGEFDDYESMDNFFTGFMVEQTPSHVLGVSSDRAPSGHHETRGMSVAASDEAIRGPAV